MTIACRHCGVPSDSEFCCTGCATAYQIGQDHQRATHGLIPDVPVVDYTRYVTRDEGGRCVMVLMVEGMRCAACAFLIERLLNVEPNVAARMNLTTRRLTLRWVGDSAIVPSLIAKVAAQGYQLMPFDLTTLENTEQRAMHDLLRYLAVAGFASGNIMIVADALWAANTETMGMATRDFLHWLSALIALPTVIYAGQPFFVSAWQALRHRRTNMDVPIAVALTLTTMMSMVETIQHGDYVYFDCVTMLLFLLLAGRYLDRQARGRARNAAQNLLVMTAGSALVVAETQTQLVPIAELQKEMVLQVAQGERIAADGVVIEGESDIDPSLMTGETLATPVKQGDKVFSGMVNLSAPLKIKITAVGAESLLGSMVQLMEQAEQGHAHYVRLADRIAAYYTPVVHLLALGTFMLWWLVVQSGWQPALLTAMTVLIITCPCALGLAVPVVQVLASSRLFKQGLLLKAADALERLAQVDVVVFDKTGSLTVGKPRLVNGDDIPADAFRIAASVALHSRHPLARALLHHGKGGEPDAVASVTEYAGVGMAAIWQGQPVRLGRRDWCGDKTAAADDCAELWLQVGETKPVRFVFADKVRVDAAVTCAALQRLGYDLHVVSGDRPQVVSVVAAQLGITQWHAGVTPVGKADFIRALQRAGRKVLMVGDGMNDAPALTVADVSLSPSTALDIAQNAADIVFQGDRLAPVLQALQVSKRTQALVLQNFLLAFIYNIIAIPLAMLGYVTPLVAAVAMASSSVLVVLNAQRILIGRNRS